MASIARSIEIISERDSAPSLRRMRATWCSTVLAEMNNWLPMSRYGMPSSSSSATSRSRSDSRDDCWRGEPVGAGEAGGRFDTGTVVDGGGQLEVAGQLQHRAGHPPVGGLQRRLAGQPGGVGGEPELRQRPGRGGDLVESTWLASTRSQVRPAPASAFANACVPAAAVSAWPCGATASGELERIPACTPAQCRGTDHSTGFPNEASSANASFKCVLQTVDLPQSGCSDPQFAERKEREEVDGVFGEHFHGGVPMLVNRSAVTVAARDGGVQGRRPERVAAMQRGVARRSGVGGRVTELSVLHPHPAEKQPVPMSREGAVLAAGAHRPPDDAAGPHRVAAVQGGQCDQCGRRVRRDARLLMFGHHGLTEAGDGDGERFVQ